MLALNRVIHIQPKDVWNFYIQHEKNLKEKALIIAESLEFQITLSTKDNFPLLSVYETGSNKPVDELRSFDFAACTRDAQMLFESYLDEDDIILEEASVLNELDEDDIDDLCILREDEILLATSEYLNIILGEEVLKDKDVADVFGEKLIDTVVDAVFKSIHNYDKSIKLYRPIVSENAEWIMYPYNKD